MKVFIDANVLLDIYSMSGPDLEELRKLIKLLAKNKIEVVLTAQVHDEFRRNRERVIAESLKRFGESKAQASIPNLMRHYPAAKELKELADQFAAKVKELQKSAATDIAKNELKADEVINELFNSVEIHDVPTSIVDAADLRMALGNPPGKNDSLGDGINWEWLLSQDPSFYDAELIILSADKDFASPLTPEALGAFLHEEFTARFPETGISLSTSLPKFMSKHFPDIKLADEIDKVEAIEHLEQAGSFAATHLAIAKLSTHDDLKPQEVTRLLKAFKQNNQIAWILGDDDVRAFAAKLLSLPTPEDAQDFAAHLTEQLAAISV